VRWITIFVATAHCLQALLQLRRGTLAAAQLRGNIVRKSLDSFELSAGLTLIFQMWKIWINFSSLFQNYATPLSWRPRRTTNSFGKKQAESF